ncbi:GNAT family N-acetyltransferase [Nocardioides aurantiacus]|uniref:Acetyltransferase (GNAT) family protein n=1 Tax=Nocardioides aurantiacus TaxID=86796 RepID=A0A3N2CR42_9ACTN|nr:GNAT family N-acetyltransferase [Nocardioides aurantiacus]ROR89969.1 acetyltransferase (GNAT) family protein [Nocardioides aurantiacus]
MCPVPGFEVVRRSFTHPDSQRLVEEVQQEYVVRYGGPDLTPLDASYFEPPLGSFFVGYLDGEPVATGAWRRRTDVAYAGTTATAEIKRMYVVEGARGRGLARAVLAHLERTAHEAGAEVMVLETGEKQPEAIALYESSGYREIPGFGFYADAPLSRCYARPLGERAAWDAAAPTFDDEPDHGLRDPAVREAWRTLLLGALPPAPARVADLGCGTGTLSALLAAEGYAVTGVDFAPAMVERALAAGVDARTGDAADPPLDAASYDVVLCRHVLWALPDPATALRRWVSLLVPGGRLVLVEGRWHTGSGLAMAECVELVRAVAPSLGARLLDDPALWGGPTTDERYLVVGRVG